MAKIRTLQLHELFLQSKNEALISAWEKCVLEYINKEFMKWDAEEAIKQAINDIIRYNDKILILDAETAEILHEIDLRNYGGEKIPAFSAFEEFIVYLSWI